MTNFELKTDNNNCIFYKFRLLDTKILGLKTIEILKIKYKNREGLAELLRLFNEKCKLDKIGFILTRIDSNDRILKKGLQESGFYYAETSFFLQKRDIQNYDFFSKIKNRVILQAPRESDFKQIKEIAKNDFEYGRFFEDPNIDITKAKYRQYNWIDSLLEQKKEFLVYKKGDEVLGFHCQSISDNTADMILTGVAGKVSMIALPFWASVLDSLKKRGIKYAHTIISASNIGVVNLYSFFDFKFERTLLGFHKLHQEEKIE